MPNGSGKRTKGLQASNRAAALNGHQDVGRLVRTLYRNPVQATRRGALFNAFAYPTKISPESIALLVASHTKPGDTVLDIFAGSGTTGLAAILCADPPDHLRQLATSLKLKVEWGPRRAVLFEIGALGAFISKILTSPPDPERFVKAAQMVLRETERELAWMYDAVDPDGNIGSIRYIVWSDVMRCPSCSNRVPFWKACVRRRPAQITSVFRCPRCRSVSSVDHAQRVRTREADPILRTSRTTRLRRPAWVYGRTGSRSWSRAAQPSDLRLFKRVSKLTAPSTIPKQRVPWGDLYRSGYHEGITHLHHFYTHRNLIALGTLLRQVERAPRDLRDALRFWVLSYNASHSTLMTRVVAKAGHDDLVVTSAQPGVLYVSGLPVEKNVFDGLRRKLRTIAAAFKIARPYVGLVDVRNSSSLSTHLRDRSIDYVFTDPPFGGNIPYAEVNFINEAWLGRLTQTREEVIVSRHQGKTIDDYGILLSRAFAEAYRVLRPQAAMTVIFHSSSAAVWNRLREACDSSGFKIATTSVLDKTQASFKQVTTNGSVKGDPMILLSKNGKPHTSPLTTIATVVERLRKQALSAGDPEEMTPQRLYSRLVAYYLERAQAVPVGARQFYKWYV